jgi:hypothetical protein
VKGSGILPAEAPEEQHEFPLIRPADPAQFYVRFLACTDGGKDHNRLLSIGLKADETSVKSMSMGTTLFKPNAEGQRRKH